MACSIDKKAEFVPEWKGWGEYFDFWDQFSEAASLVRVSPAMRYTVQSDMGSAPSDK